MKRPAHLRVHGRGASPCLVAERAVFLIGRHGKNLPASHTVALPQKAVALSGPPYTFRRPESCPLCIYQYVKCARWMLSHAIFVRPEMRIVRDQTSNGSRYV